jgi:2,5-diketo-D-gluconate reductase A
MSHLGMLGYADIFDFELTPDQMAAIAKMDTSEALFFDHRDPGPAIRLGSRTID